MCDQQTTSHICDHLRNLMVSEGTKLEYVALSAHVGVDTVRRAKNGEVTSLWDRTAVKLAGFIEKETEGRVTASHLLDSNLKDFAGTDLRGVDLSGEDLSGYIFVDATLSGADLSEAHGVGVDFRCANLRGARLHNVHFHRSDFSAANMQGVELSGTIERSMALAADLADATFHELTWDASGSRTRGIRLPDFDPASVQRAHGDHDFCAQLLLWEFPGDFEILQIVEHIKARMLQCYFGLVERVLTVYPHRVADIEAAWAKYPKWVALERWSFVKEARETHTLAGWRRLHKQYAGLDRWFRLYLDRKIRGLEAAA